jgi:hypothetical protein
MADKPMLIAVACDHKLAMRQSWLKGRIRRAIITMFGKRFYLVASIAMFMSPYLTTSE